MFLYYNFQTFINFIYWNKFALYSLSNSEVLIIRSVQIFIVSLGLDTI
jgi:hypothetical protein